VDPPLLFCMIKEVRQMSREKGRFKKQSPKNIGRWILPLILMCIAAGLVSGVLLKNKRGGPENAPTAQFTAEATMPVVFPKTARDHYAPVLGKYHRAIVEGWSKEQCEIEGISLRMQTDSDVSKAGYALLDLDGDGREELIIAEEALPHINHVWDIYTTVKDGTPIQLWVDELDGNQCYLYEGNVIGTEYTTKTEAEYIYYTLENGQLVMRESLQYADEDTVFHMDADGNTRHVTSKEAMDISYAYDIQKLELTRFE